MAEVFTSDNSVPAEVMESQAAEEADSLRIGEELEAAQNEKLAGKYNSAAELEAAYLQLQKKLGSNDEPEAEAASEESSDWFYDAVNSYQETGELTAEMAEAIEGLNARDVFEAMAGNNPTSTSRDLSDSELSTVFQSVGGEESYQNMVVWARTNFSQQEIDAYDAVMDSGNVAQINFALQALSYRYADAVGTEGEMLQGKPARAVDTFRSQAELIQAMSDPRYENDEAYRGDVIAKLQQSDLNW